MKACLLAASLVVVSSPVLAQALPGRTAPPPTAPATAPATSIAPRAAPARVVPARPQAPVQSPAGPSSLAPRGPLLEVGATPTVTFLFVEGSTVTNGRTTAWFWKVYATPDTFGGTVVDARAERVNIDCASRTMMRTRYENHGPAGMTAGADIDGGPLGGPLTGGQNTESGRFSAVACGFDYPGKGDGARFATIEAAITGLR